MMNVCEKARYSSQDGTQNMRRAAGMWKIYCSETHKSICTLFSLSGLAATEGRTRGSISIIKILATAERKGATRVCHRF